jgi:cobaltochelatase CobN
MTAALVLISTADTDLLAAKAADAQWRVANPSRLEADAVAALVDGAGAVVVRLLGGRRTWPEGLDAVLASGLPVIALGGETTPDAELTALSTVAAGVAHDALRYLVEGGPDNLRELHRFLSDTLLLTGEGFEAPAATPQFGVHGTRAADPAKATVGVVFYRAHALSGNTAFVETLCDALEDSGVNALPVFVPSLREVSDELTALLGRCDALVVTVLAAGGTRPSDASAGGDGDAWSVDALAALDIPVIQGLCLTGSFERWDDSDAALSPMDAAMQVAIPEFDGRLISVPFSFKQEGPDGIGVYIADAERAARVAGIAVGYARLRHIPNADKKIALVLSSYPTKHARVGNAVGLDTPASAVVLIAALKDAGYDVGDVPTDGDALIHTLIAAGGHDVEFLTEEQLANAPIRVPTAQYRAWFDALEPSLRQSMLDVWGEPPGTLYVDGDAIVLAGLQFGNLSLMIQPPRGFGENPIAIYHDPELAPSHHYLAAYRWMAGNVDAVVHLGKHGTLEWLPGKGLGLSAGCAPDAVLGDLPLVYPFIVNDPGEGTQAKRRAHATIIDHLVPPMARADTYGDMAKLEQLLDEYATVQALDPSKVPVVRAQIWTLIQAAQLHHDLHVDSQPDDDAFDDFVLHVDGYLCEIKDSQIRDGLHILGGAPQGEARVNLVLAVLRARQVWGGNANAMPGLRDALAQHVGLDEYVLIGDNTRIDVPKALTSLVDGPAVTAADAVDLLETLARRLVQTCDDAGWNTDGVVTDVLGADAPAVETVLRFAATEVVPRLAATTDEITASLRALDGGYVAAGPSGSPTRGLVNVLPTGRNFYSVDPKAIPSRNAWDTGLALADSLLARHVEDTGEHPKLVGLTVWGTSAMRTQGDDIAEVLALIGCRPVWDDASRRVTGFEIVPLSELGRPRIDVTVRISGFFRDAFPHVIALMDDAISAVAALPESDEDNFVAAHSRSDQAVHGDNRRATTRIFGSKPGAYGAGLLPLIDARNWRDDRDLAEVYAVWGGYAYGKGLDGRPARDDLETVYRRMSVAAKNVDTREHDIADSDDYFQYHGGMVAMVRSLRGSDPAAYIGDSHRPEQVKTRSLAEETKRVFRARVVNPRWIAAMQRHGYKGAFELAATVDYLFGYDATAGVVDDWMYESLAASYVADPGVREFLETSNPWALRGIAERLLEAADRKLWAEPEPATLDMLREAYLAVEGDLEGA